MTIPKIIVVLVNWNGKIDTLECLASLRQDTYSSKQVIVVDNGSKDDSVAAIQAAHPEVTILETGANLGFTGGNNVGIRHALEQDADYIYLLNNDTTVEPDALTKLVEAAKAHCEYGLLTPVIHYFDRPDEAWFAGAQLDLSHGIAVHDNSRVPARDEPPITIPWASGCAMLFRADLLHRLNGFDDRYFLNWEDVDLSLRVTGSGSQIGLVPAARIYHKVGRSFATAAGVSCYYYVRNNLLLASHHSGAAYPAAMRYIIAERLRDALRNVKKRKTLANTGLGFTLRAIRDHFTHRYGRLPSTQ
jgi:GT2 family glycosyltransferase